MNRYRTEILVPPDRYLCLQLPPQMPEGWAVVSIEWLTPEKSASMPPSAFTPAEGPEPDLDQQDIEWWDEFEARDDEPEPVPHEVSPLSNLPHVEDRRSSVKART